MSDNNLGIVIISKQNNIEKLQQTIDNLKENSFQKNEFIVTSNKQNSTEIEKFCNENEITYYKYENTEDIYFQTKNIIKCKYISFINEGDKYSLKLKEKLNKQIEKDGYENIFICPIKYEKSKYILNKNLSKASQINIEKDPKKIWININSCFINKKLLDKLDIKKQIINNIEETIILKLISLNGRYSIIGNIKLEVADMLEDSPIAKEEYYEKAWYNNRVTISKELLSFSENEYNSDLKFIQYSIMYIIKNCINSNVNVKNKHILKDNELEKFYNKIKEVLQKIDDEIIMNTIGNKLVNYYLLRLKYNLLKKDIEYREFLNNICVTNNEKFVFNATDTKIKILLMDYVAGKLIITATYPFPFDENKLEIYAKYKNKVYKAKRNALYSKYKAFGLPLYESYAFDLEIPLETSNDKQYIEFYLKGQNANVKLDINFNKPLSRLSGLKYSYWNCGKFTLNYRRNSILVMNNSKLRYIKRELRYIISLLNSKNEHAKKSGELRILYYLTKPFFRKEIWLFEDKIYKGGDNGEYLYTYASKQKDGIKKYYILKKGCIDAERFKEEHKKYVIFGSLKHKLLFLNSNIVFETHNNVTKQHSFDENIEKYFRDLYNSNNVCIQHGLTVQNIPHLTNRINDNLKQFFLASPVEKENMENDEYSYQGHMDILKITGSPRYDGLKNNEKKQILITPTWRSYLALPSFHYGESRGHNDNFKNSEYFKIYNNLINNKKLINTAKKYGYKIIYLLHPCTSSQINDYDKNEFVELVAATDDLNYEKILTESSLMVTDYSGVQFDFAYMYKPIIYFHPDELPPSYEEGEYKYETMALGEITKTNEETVSLLCEYMENGCKIKGEYEKRIDKFFKYHDDKNSERIYNKIMRFRKEVKSGGLLNE